MAASTPLSAALNACCQLATCMPELAFWEVTRRLVAQINVMIVMVRSAVIRTVPRSRIKMLSFMLLSGVGVAEEGVAINLGGFDVLNFGERASGLVVDVAYLVRIDRGIVRHDHIPIAIVPDGVSWRACIRRS